jgi:N-carbamoylputrescine amidase
MPIVGLVQMAMETNRQDNLDKAEAMIRQAVKDSAEIICLPELFHSVFWCAFPPDLKYFEWAEPVPGPTVERFQHVARETKAVLIIPLWEKVGRSVYFNSAAVIDADGGLIGTYRKNHIPLSPLFQEKVYFKPGNLGYPVFKTHYGNVGVYICHDRHYPEGARCLALAGADIIFVPTATNDASLSGKVWEKELMAHAIFNEIFIAGLNRVGKETGPDGREFVYYGRSLVINPLGGIIEQVEGEECNLLCEVNWSEIDQRRIAWQFYRDRRPETYELITKFVP